MQSLIAHFTVSTKATHFGIITYSTDPTLEFDLAEAKYHGIVELKKRVMEINYPGQWTRTDKALQMAAQKLFTVAGGDRKDKPNILVVFTDGKTNRGSKPYPEVLRPLQVRIGSQQNSHSTMRLMPPLFIPGRRYGCISKYYGQYNDYFLDVCCVGSRDTSYVRKI